MRSRIHDDETRDLGWDQDASPRFPGAIMVAGIIWIVYGMFVALSGLFWVTWVSMAGTGPIHDPAWFMSSILMLTFGIVFILLGFLHVTGKARDTLGSAIWSLVIGLCHTALGIFALANSFGPPTDGHGIQGVINLVLRGLAFFALVGGVGLMLAGSNALAGRRKFLRWKRYVASYQGGDAD